MTAMLYDGYNAWDECPEADNCELIRSFLELVDAMVRDIQHLKAEAVRARIPVCHGNGSRAETDHNS